MQNEYLDNPGKLAGPVLAVIIAVQVALIALGGTDAPQIIAICSSVLLRRMITGREQEEEDYWKKVRTPASAVAVTVCRPSWRRRLLGRRR